MAPPKRNSPSATAAIETRSLGRFERDVIAARAAGMLPVVAGYGYLHPDCQPETWNAAAIIDEPAALTSRLLREGCDS